MASFNSAQDLETCVPGGLGPVLVGGNYDGKLYKKTGSVALEDSPRGTIKCHHPVQQDPKESRKKRHFRSRSAVAFKELFKTSFRGPDQYHRLQEIEHSSDFEAAGDHNSPRIPASDASKRQLPVIPCRKPSSQCALLKSALSGPRGSLSRMSSTVRKAGQQLVMASSKIAHVHRHFKRSKSHDEVDMEIWMVVNPMFNQPGTEPAEEAASEACTFCKDEGMPSITRYPNFESWVNTAVFGLDPVCLRTGGNHCSACGCCSRTRSHYRTQSLGDISLWDSQVSIDSSEFASSILSSVDENEATHI